MDRKLTVKAIENYIKQMNTEAALDYLESQKENYGSALDRLIDKYIRKKQVADKEIERYIEMSRYEKEAYLKGYRFVAGIDEAGRGPLAGPVVAGAVILPEKEIIPGINDSKQLTPVKRDVLYDIIKEKSIAWGIGICDEKCIDETNILQATREAMIKAVAMLKPQPDIVLIDAEKLDNLNMERVSIIKGDCLSVSIAAASIIAKVTRDRMLEELDARYPQYGFSKHKGYGTREHIAAIKKYGICPIHRISFTRNITV